MFHSHEGLWSLRLVAVFISMVQIFPVFVISKVKHLFGCRSTRLLIQQMEITVNQCTLLFKLFLFSILCTLFSALFHSLSVRCWAEGESWLCSALTVILLELQWHHPLLTSSFWLKPPQLTQSHHCIPPVGFSEESWKWHGRWSEARSGATLSSTATLSRVEQWNDGGKGQESMRLGERTTCFLDPGKWW